MTLRIAPARAGYLVSPERRPRLRGCLVGWLQHSGAWLVLVVGYTLTVAWHAGFAAHVSVPRVMFAAATCWCTWLSDWLHNLDLKMGPKASVEMEFLYYRMDMLSISVIMSVQSLLWSSNCAWGAGAAHGIASFTATVLNTALLFWPGDAFLRHNAILSVVVKVVYGIQFLLLGWLGYVWVFHTKCGIATSIWFVYLPGFLAFVSKPMIGDYFENFGPHEVFHAFVWAGHVVTMGMDAFMNSPFSTECPAGSVEVTW